jgi:hypothetical protein
MIARLVRLLRRRWLAMRVVQLKSEIVHLEHEREHIGPALDRALRQLGHARIDLAMLDVRRPPINRASGPGKRDGITRFSLLAANRRTK